MLTARTVSCWSPGEEDCADGEDEYEEVCAVPSAAPSSGASHPPTGAPATSSPATSAPTTQAPTSAAPTELEACGNSELECEESGLCLPAELACDGELPR